MALLKFKHLHKFAKMSIKSIKMMLRSKDIQIKIFDETNFGCKIALWFVY